jgi:hypothetical protein
MLVIENIDKLVGSIVASNGNNWQVTKINSDSSDDYYGIVVRELPIQSGEYVVFYLDRKTCNIGEYYMSSNKSNIKRMVNRADLTDMESFRRLIAKEMHRVMLN